MNMLKCCRLGGLVMARLIIWKYRRELWICVYNVCVLLIGFSSSSKLVICTSLDENLHQRVRRYFSYQLNSRIFIILGARGPKTLRWNLFLYFLAQNEENTGECPIAADVLYTIMLVNRLSWKILQWSVPSVGSVHINCTTWGLGLMKRV